MPAASSRPARPAYVVLARKYRPQTFDDLIGQEAMVTTLRNAFAAERIAQGYMLTGVRGVGKTTTARILARALNYLVPGKAERPTVDMPELGVHCREIMESRHPDVIEMDAASNTGIDNIREIIESARYKPTSARTKVFIIDEVHMLSKGAFNALLKTLEEPPEHVKFIFATTEVRKVPVTVLSRCQRFDLRRVEVSTLTRHFERIVAAEGANASPDALGLIARAAEGSVRDGLSILDQAIAMGSGEVSVAAVRAMLGLADRGRIFDLTEAIAAGDVARALTLLEELVRDGADPVELLADLADTLHQATRLKVAGATGAADGLSEAERARAHDLARRLSLAYLSRAWQMLLRGIEEAARAPSASAAAEMVIIRLALVADLPAPDEVIRVIGGGTSAGAPGRRDAAPSPASSRTERSDAGGGRAAAGAEADRNAQGADEAPPFVPSENPRGPEYDDDPGEGLDDPAERPLPGGGPLEVGLFEDVLDLVGRHREARLKVHLEENVSLVRFDPAGSIELHLLPHAPKEIANELREKLNAWTGRRWMVALSRQAGARPVAEVRREREAAERHSLESHPAIRAVLDALPEARIVDIRPLKRNPDDDAATG